MAVSTSPYQAKGVPEELSALSNPPALPQGFLLSSPRSILFSWGCRNKLPQTEWLKTTEIILSQFWRLEDWNKMWQSRSPSRGSRKAFFLAISSVRWLQVFLGVGLRSSMSSSVFTWSSLCVSVCPLLTRTLVSGFTGPLKSRMMFHLKIPD